MGGGRRVALDRLAVAIHNPEPVFRNEVAATRGDTGPFEIGRVPCGLDPSAEIRFDRNGLIKVT